jgi:hypothetical protein
MAQVSHFRLPAFVFVSLLHVFDVFTFRNYLAMVRRLLLRLCGGVCKGFLNGLVGLFTKHRVVVETI